MRFKLDLFRNSLCLRKLSIFVRIASIERGLLLPILFFFNALYGEAPWGKDADLIHFSKQEPVVEELSLLKKFASLLINFHQDVVSPIDGPRSHFFPSSSQYTKEAIQKHGFLLGVTLGCDRLMRENDDPWVYATCTAPDGRKLKLNLIP